MKYIEFSFTLKPMSDDAQDLLCAALGEAGFDSFEPGDAEGKPLKAYVKAAALNEAAMEAAIGQFPLKDVQISYEARPAEDKDWNRVWEENYFRPLVVDGRCAVYGSMHTEVPDAPMKIVINPKMSFGTGHHATTSQMLSELLKLNLRGKRVLDMGCGTSILAIAARKHGAAYCLAVDNDEWCVENSLENLELNHTEGIDVELGEVQAIAGRGPFDVILANINRNILLNDMKAYCAEMAEGATLLISGFYDSDLPILADEAVRCGLKLVGQRTQDRWCCARFELSPSISQ